MTNKTYTFKLPIGDFSKDGHGMCDWYRIESNYPVEDVREFYFKACEMAGFKFNEVFCSYCEDYAILEEQLQEYPLPFDLEQYKAPLRYDCNECI